MWPIPPPPPSNRDAWYCPSRQVHAGLALLSSSVERLGEVGRPYPYNSYMYPLIYTLLPP